MQEWILLELCFVDFFPLTHPIVIAKGPGVTNAPVNLGLSLHPKTSFWLNKKGLRLCGFESFKGY